jgi:hypothetical protein
VVVRDANVPMLELAVSACPSTSLTATTIDPWAVVVRDANVPILDKAVLAFVPAVSACPSTSLTAATIVFFAGISLPRTKIDCCYIT